MSGAVLIKRQLLAVILAWPIAFGAGWVVSQLIHQDWPLALFPIAWLGLLFFTLRSYGDWRE